MVFSGKSWSYVIRISDPITGKTKPAWLGSVDIVISVKLARDKPRVALSQRDYIAPTKLTGAEYLIAWIRTR